MKKTFVMVALAMMTMTTVSAQSHDYYETKHEVGVAIGTGSMTELLSGLADMTEVVVSTTVSMIMAGSTISGCYTYGEKSYLPTISAEYCWHVNKVVGWGGVVAFNGMDRDMYIEWTGAIDGAHHKEKTGTAKHRNLSVVPVAKIDWLRKRYFGLYSKAGLGVTFMHETQKDDVEGGTDYSSTTVIPNFQASVLGLELGCPTIRAFAEMGLGEQGMLLAGLKYKF